MKGKKGEYKMSLREVREYYGKSTGLLSFMNLIFVMVIGGMGIYIADIMSANDENQTKVFCLYTVFVVGLILAILLIISCFMGRNGNYETALRFRRLLAVIGCVIGIISLMVSAVTIAETYKEWEEGYTFAIFIIQLVGSILAVAACITLFVFSAAGGKYYDSKKAAKDIPEAMTAEKNKRKYMFLINISYVVLSVSVFLLSLYFAVEIDSYSIQDLTDNSRYSSIYEIIFKAGLITTILVFASGVLLLCVKSQKVYALSKAAYIVNTIVQAVFVIYSILNISKDFVKAQYPDITYIVFGIILAVISFVFAMKSYFIAKTA